MAHNPDREIEQLITFFHQAGISDLDDRLFVTRTFLNMGRHPTLDELVEEIAPLRPDLDAVFVDETMQLLNRFGFAQKLAFEGEPLRYEHHHIGCHHDHLVCKCCGKILEFEDPEIEALQERIAGRYGFTLLRHRMELYGLCANCSREREAWMTLSRADAGEKFFIDGFLGGPECRTRLLSMGLKTGDALEVISNYAGHVVIAVNHCRYSLGSDMSEKILVRKNKKKPFVADDSFRDTHRRPEDECRCTGGVEHHDHGRGRTMRKMLAPFFKHRSHRPKK